MLTTMLALVVVWVLLATATNLDEAGLVLVTALTTLGATAAHSRLRHTGDVIGESSCDPHLVTIETLAGAIEARERSTPAHAQRVQAYAVALARSMNFSREEIQAIRVAALLHDIGMLAIPECILWKSDPLTDEELEMVRRHPKVGADILESVPFPLPVAPLIRSHHERWDGRGYPDGLSGEQIPIGARILAVAEMYDTLTSNRPYHNAISHDAALQLLTQEAGASIDPALIKQFIKVLSTIEEIGTGDSPSAKAVAGDLRERVPPLDECFYSESKRTHHEAYALYDLARSLGASLGVTKNMTLIAAKLKQLVPYSCCALFLPDVDGERLQCRFVMGTDAAVIGKSTAKISEVLSTWVACARRPFSNSNHQLGTAATTALQSVLVTPLMSQDRLIGTLALYHVDKDFYTDDHACLTARVGGQVEPTIANSLLFDRAQEDSLTDPLTALPNTRSLVIHLTHELARAKRLQNQLALLVVDLDNFKQINDHHGHHVGDRALCAVAHTLRSVIRTYDVCARYAGDEFILLLSGCTNDEAHCKRRDLQAAIAATEVKTVSESRLLLKASIGIAMYPADGENYETLLTAADRHMYRDKTRQKHRATGAHALENKTYTDAQLRNATLGLL